MGLPDYIVPKQADSSGLAELISKDELNQDTDADWYRYFCELLAATGGNIELTYQTRADEGLALIDSYRYDKYLDAIPHVRALLAQMSDEDINKSANNTKVNLKRQELFQEMLEYVKPSFLKRPKTFKAIPNLLPITAEGIVKLVESGKLPWNDWLKIYLVYDRITKTAEGYNNNNGY